VCVCVCVCVCGCVCVGVCVCVCMCAFQKGISSQCLQEANTITGGNLCKSNGHGVRE
jgi:hypothetical protein